MWPSVSSPAMPAGNHTTRWSPRADRSSASMSCLVRPLLRLGLSRHSSVTKQRPAPLTSMEPPSSTIPGVNAGSPSHSLIRGGTASSATYSGYFIPHALNRQLTKANAPDGSSRVMKVGP